MTKDGQPSTVTTVRLVGGFCGGRVGSSSLPTSSWGKCSRELVMEQGTSSSFFMYLTWGAKNNRKELSLKRVFLQNGSAISLGAQHPSQDTKEKSAQVKHKAFRIKLSYIQYWAACSHFCLFGFLFMFLLLLSGFCLFLKFYLFLFNSESALPSPPFHWHHWQNDILKVLAGDTGCLKELKPVTKEKNQLNFLL